MTICCHANQADKWLEVWERLDCYGEGEVSLRKMEYTILNLPIGDAFGPRATLNILRQADLNKDGKISKNEFLDLVTSANKSNALARLKDQLLFLAIPRSARTLHTRRYIDEYNCRPPPLFILSITFVEMITFIVYAATSTQPITANGPSLFHSVLIYDPTRRYEVWRFATYMFVHSGYLHLISNIIVQLLLGCTLELVHKWWRVLVVYLLGVIGASLATSVTTPAFYLAGASGGVYSLEYAYLGNLIINWSEMTFPVIQATTIVLISILDVSYAIWDSYFSATPTSTGYVAHIGGALTGLLIGVNVLRNLEKEPWEKILWWICLAIFLSLFTIAIMVHIFCPGYFPAQTFDSLSSSL